MLDTLVSRPAFARALLDAMAAGKVPPAELTAFHARQIRSLNRPDLDRRHRRRSGESSATRVPEKRALMAPAQAAAHPRVLAAADPGRGRVVFNKLCASCHTALRPGGARSAPT